MYTHAQLLTLSPSLTLIYAPFLSLGFIKISFKIFMHGIELQLVPLGCLFQKNVGVAWGQHSLIAWSNLIAKQYHLHFHSHNDHFWDTFWSTYIANLSLRFKQRDKLTADRQTH